MKYIFTILTLIALSTVSQAQMQEERVENSQVIAVPARKAWNLIKDFRNFPRLLPSVDRTEVKGKGEKASWIIYLKNGVVIKEVTTSFSNREMNMSYRMTETPMPLENYVGTFRVESLGKNKCKVYFITTFEVLPANKNTLLETFQGVQKTFLNNIEKNI
ncbi:MAG: SRPBCC family protein [Bacteroidota bacterium]